MDTNYQSEFNRLRDWKNEEAVHLEELKGMIKRILERYPGGIPVGVPDGLTTFLQRYQEQHAEALRDVIEHPEIWSIVCDTNDIMRGASPFSLISSSILLKK